MFVRRALVASAAVLSLSVALAGPALAAPAGLAGGGFDVTVNGSTNGQPVTGLPQTSTLDLDVVNLPGSVGLYAFHCLVPANPMAVPTRCDFWPGALAYEPATGADRATLSIPLVVSAQFLGANPNPLSGDDGRDAVDCRSQTCAIYTLGAGQASTDPTYIRFFPTVFTPVGDRTADMMRMRVGKRIVPVSAHPILKAGKTYRISVTMASGLPVSVSSDSCVVNMSAGTISPLVDKGTCTVTVLTTGLADYQPFDGQRTFRIKK